MKLHELRVVEEQNELQIKIDALISFLDKGKPSFICTYQWELLDKQLEFMVNYNKILKERINAFTTP